MKGHKCRDYKGYQTCQDISCHHDEATFVIECVWLGESVLQYRVACRDNQNTTERGVKEHVHEELVVVKTDTVCHPRAVMVHLQDARVALGAVMTSIWFRLVTPLADSHSSCQLLSLNVFFQLGDNGLEVI